MTKKKESVKVKVRKNLSVKEYVALHPELDRYDVYDLIKDGKLTAHKGARGAWVIVVEEETTTKETTKKAKKKEIEKEIKKYSTKEFLELYNEKHPKSTITLVELRLMLTNGKVVGEKVGGKWEVYQSPSKRIK